MSPLKNPLLIRSRVVDPEGVSSLRHALFAGLQKWRELSRQLLKELKAFGA